MRDVQGQSLFVSDMLRLKWHEADINHQPIYTGHPDHRVVVQLTRHRQGWIKGANIQKFADMRGHVVQCTLGGAQGTAQLVQHDKECLGAIIGEVHASHGVKNGGSLANAAQFCRRGPSPPRPVAW